MFAGILGSAAYVLGNKNRIITQERNVHADMPKMEDGYIPSALTRFGYRRAPPQRPFVKIRLPLAPNPGEQHILIPEIIVTPEYTTSYQMIARSCSEIITPDIRLNPVYTSDSNNMDTHSKHTIYSDIVDSLLYNQSNNGTHHQYFHSLQ